MLHNFNHRIIYFKRISFSTLC